ncbi:MAG: phosphatidylglycerophosphatase A [Thiolinea sp.]
MSAAENSLSQQALVRTVLKSPVHFFAFGFGSGLSPKAPGTVGTLAAVPLYLLLLQLPVAYYVLALLLTTLFGIWVCGKSSQLLGVHDHGGIVWDEFVGFWITMLMAPAGWWWIVTGFILFRIFDIWKPWPIRAIDRKVAGGLGIMLDDILAGFFALAVMQLLALLVGA